MAASTANCEAIWLRKLIVELTCKMLEPTMIYCDNKSCIKLSENPVFHDHSDKSEYVRTNQQIADILTKPLAKGKFEMFIKLLGVIENTFLGKRECQNLYLRQSSPAAAAS
jgi:hypothetical protein